MLRMPKELRIFMIYRPAQIFNGLSSIFYSTYVNKVAFIATYYSLILIESSKHHNQIREYYFNELYTWLPTYICSKRFYTG